MEHLKPTAATIVLSRPDFDSAYEDSIRRRDVIYETYCRAVEAGDRNVYFIDGESVYRGPYRAMATVDGCHPNDLGAALMADVIESTLMLALARSTF